MNKKIFIEQSRKNTDVIFSTPEKPSRVCELFSKSKNQNIKIVAIPLFPGIKVACWVGVYGIKTPEKTKFINPFSELVFTYASPEAP